MNLLDRKLLRDLWAIRARMAALVAIVACGVAIWVGIELATTNLLGTQDRMLDAHRAADLELVLLPEDVHNLPDFAALPGVEAVGQRLIMPGTIDLADGSPLAALMLFLPEPEPAINQLRLLEGRPFRPGAREVVIDRALAELHGYRVGDPIAVRVGEQTYRHTVVGIALSPEFLVTSSNPDYVIAEVGTLGVVYSDLAQVSDALGFTMVNDLLLRFEPGVDPRTARQTVLAAAGRLQLEKAIPREEGYSYKSVRMDVTAFRVYSPAIVVTLLALSVAMGGITFRRFVVEKQAEFGVLRVLGFSRQRLAAALLRLGLGLGLGGGLAGLVLGLGLGWGFAEVYAGAMHLPVVEHAIDAATALAGLLVGVAAALVAVTAASLPLLGRSPRELLNGSLSGAAARPPRWAGSALLGYTLRSLWRERGLTLAAVLAMAGAVAVAVSYGIAMTSTFTTVEHSFDSERWDYAVDFQYPLYTDEAAELAGDRAAEAYLRTAVDLRQGQGHVIALAVGVAADSRLRPQSVARGRPLGGSGEAVLSTDLVRDLALELGDRLRVEKGNQSLELELVGVTNDIFLGTLTLTLADLQTLAQLPDKVSGLYLAGGTAAGLRDRQETARVTDKHRLVGHFRQEIQDMLGIVYITIGFSVGVLLLFVTTLIHLGIAEKRGEYAVLRSLGLAARRLRRMILLRVALQLTAAQLLAIPLALTLAQALNARMGAAWFAVNTYTVWTDFAWPMLAALVVAPVAALVGVRAVLSLNVADWLRRRMI